MDNAKRKTMVICALVQALYAFILVIFAFVLFAKWTFNPAEEIFLPSLYNGFLALLKDDHLITQVLVPLMTLFLSVILLSTSAYILKKPIDKKTNKERKQWIYVVIAFLVNLFLTLVGLICVFSIKSQNANLFLGILFCVVVGLVTIFELVSLFLQKSTTQVLEQVQATQSATTTTNQPTEQAENNCTNTTNTNVVNTTQAINTPLPQGAIHSPWYISTAEFIQRAIELYRLAKNQNISDDNLVSCLQDLMTLPIEAPYDFKIKHLNKFSSNGYLTQQQISRLICQAITTKNTTPFKKRIKYLEYLKCNKVINESDYAVAIRMLMTYHD